MGVDPGVDGCVVVCVVAMYAADAEESVVAADDAAADAERSLAPRVQ